MSNGAPPDHQLTLGVRGVRFVGTCSCGWCSDAMPTAGLVHGAHGSHVESMAVPVGAAR